MFRFVVRNCLKLLDNARATKNTDYADCISTISIAPEKLQRPEYSTVPGGRFCRVKRSTFFDLLLQIHGMHFKLTF